MGWVTTVYFKMYAMADVTECLNNQWTALGINSQLMSEYDTARSDMNLQLLLYLEKASKLFAVLKSWYAIKETRKKDLVT